MAAFQFGAGEDDEDTKSLSESITDYPIVWGRRYHKYKEGCYFLPNDHIESERLDLQYEALKILHDGRIHFAPLKDPKRILDVGTGTGVWPIEMSSYFPNARITGIDLSPIQPSLVPPKVHFEIQDCTDSDWCRPLSSFDYIHTAIMLGSLPSYSKMMKTARRYLKPGVGWLECHEMRLDVHIDDASCPDNWPPHTWYQLVEEGAKKIDRPRNFGVADKLERWMRESGYVDVHERVDKIPINPWAKDPCLKQVGRLWERNWLDGVSPFSYKILGPEGLGWTQNEIEVFLMDVRKAVKDRTVHAYQKMYVVYGRRPSEDEERTMMNKPNQAAAANGSTPATDKEKSSGYSGAK